MLCTAGVCSCFSCSKRSGGIQKDDYLNREAQLHRARSRRKFLQFLAASPCFAQVVNPEIHYPEGWEFPAAGRTYSRVITDPSQALDVFDFEEPMHRKALPGHWAHYVTGVFSEATLHANRAGFNQVFLRPRRLVRDLTRAS